MVAADRLSSKTGTESRLEPIVIVLHQIVTEIDNSARGPVDGEGVPNVISMKLRASVNDPGQPADSQVNTCCVASAEL